MRYVLAFKPLVSSAHPALGLYNTVLPGFRDAGCAADLWAGWATPI